MHLKRGSIEAEERVNRGLVEAARPTAKYLVAQPNTLVDELQVPLIGEGKRLARTRLLGGWGMRRGAGACGQDASSDQPPEPLRARHIPERHPSHHRLFLIIYSGLGRRRGVSEA